MSGPPLRPPAAIISGGKARRMGGGDKCLLHIGDQTILSRLLGRLAGQASAIALNANGDPARFSTYGLPVVADDPAEGLGPLAGVLAALRWARSLESRWVQLVSGDTPFIPLDLSVRLQAALSDGCDLAVPESGGRLHHLCGLWCVDQLAGLSTFIDAGGRAVHEWAESRSFVTVRFDDASVDPFFNINTADDLARAERLAAGVDAP